MDPAKILVLGKPILFWLWIFAFIFLIVVIGDNIRRTLKGQFVVKEYFQQYVALGLLIILTLVLNRYYPFQKFWKGFLKLMGL